VNLFRFEALALIEINVFIQDIHAASRCFSVFSTRAEHASAIASAIAS
jgi:hypothetical protein